jgi:hypothetical protein
MSRARGWMDILAGLLALGSALPSRRRQQSRDRLALGILLLGSSGAILRGVANAVLADPSSRVAHVLRIVGSRGVGWAEILRGLDACWTAWRRPQRLPRQARVWRLITMLGGSAALVRGVADGVVADPAGGVARRLRRAGVLPILVALVLAVYQVAAVRREGLRDAARGSSYDPDPP